VSDFTGRAVIVTGASRGIGRGIARHLAKAGAALTVTGRKQSRLDETVDELRALGADVIGMVGDVAERSATDKVVAATAERFGRIDGLVNNAQTFRPVMPLDAVTDADMDLLFDTGPKGTLWAMQAVVPHMRRQQWGRIVNMGSVIGINGASGYGPYSASKEAIRALTRVAAREWARDGIVVNCVCPASAGHRIAPGDPARQEAYDRMYKDHPMGRDGDAEADIAPVVAFLLSDDCRYMTGETLLVDGGGFLRA
jgi:NAD(P)-dependent dehydrogenase (short-subunit alcohol dehydrogenase family)